MALYLGSKKVKDMQLVRHLLLPPGQYLTCSSDLSGMFTTLFLAFSLLLTVDKAAHWSRCTLMVATIAFVTTERDAEGYSCGGSCCCPPTSTARMTAPSSVCDSSAAARLRHKRLVPTLTVNPK